MSDPNSKVTGVSSNLATQIESRLKWLYGARYCAANRTKLKTILLSYLPTLTEDDLECAYKGILTGTQEFDNE